MYTDKVCFFSFESFKSPTQIALYNMHILCAFYRCGKTTDTARYKGATQVFILYITILYIGLLSYRFTDIVSLLFPFAKALLL